MTLDNFGYFCIKTYVVTLIWTDMLETAQMRGHNIWFQWEIIKVSIKYSFLSKTLLFALFQMVTKTKKIFVGGLSAQTTVEDVKKYFSSYGPVSYFKINLLPLNIQWTLVITTFVIAAKFDIMSIQSAQKSVDSVFFQRQSHITL